MPRACLAELYLLHGKGDSVIGSIRHTAATHEDTLLDVARKYGLGYMDIKLGNPGLDTWLPGENADVTLPTEFVLPAVPHEGIVLNIPEMRLYYFPPGRRNDVREVITYPLGIGREGWSTPYVDTRVIDKQQHPYWYPPKSIRLEHAQEGEPLPARVGPGPENPLGDYALRLGLPSYLIHGTNKPWGVGMRVSHVGLVYDMDARPYRKPALQGRYPRGSDLSGGASVSGRGPRQVRGQPDQRGQDADRYYRRPALRRRLEAGAPRCEGAQRYPGRDWDTARCGSGHTRGGACAGRAGGGREFAAGDQARYAITRTQKKAPPFLTGLLMSEVPLLTSS